MARMTSIDALEAKIEKAQQQVKVMKAMADMNPNLEEAGSDARKRCFSRKFSGK